MPASSRLILKALFLINFFYALSLFGNEYSSGKSIALVSSAAYSTLSLESFISENSIAKDCISFTSSSKTQDSAMHADTLPCWVEGSVLCLTGDPLQDVEIYSDGLTKTKTDENGQYMRQIPGKYSANDLNLCCTLNYFNYGAITTLDILKLQRHILGIQPLGGPYNIIAADVNRSRSLTGADLIAIRRIILGVSSSFPGNYNLRFIPADYTFLDPLNPLAEIIPECVMLEPLSGNCDKYPAYSCNFLAVLIGDVNQVPAVIDDHQSTNRTNGFTLSTPDQMLCPGQHVEIPFYVSETTDLAGFQFTVEYDTSLLTFKEINFGGLPDVKDEHFGLTQLQNGIVTVCWNAAENVSLQMDTTLFSFHFEAKEKGLLSDAIAVNSSLTRAMAVTQDFEVAPVTLAFSAPVVFEGQSIENVLFQNSPNPFYDKTVIRFSLLNPGKASITVFDASGRFVLEIFNTYNAGIHEVAIDRSALNVGGIYCYQLTTSEGSSTAKKMFLVE